MEFYFDETLVGTLNTKEPVWNYIIFYSPNKALIDTRYEIIDATVSETKIVVKYEDEMFDNDYSVSGNEITVISRNEEKGTYIDIEEYNNVKLTRYFVKEE